MRLAALGGPGHDPARVVPDAKVHQALAAHLCRCTGWQTVVEAARLAFEGPGRPELPARDVAAATRRASIEGRSTQRVGPDVALGAGSFADDTAPVDAAVALSDGAGGFVVADSVQEARARRHKVQGRRTTIEVSHPVEVPPGEWSLTLQTTWVEPAYVEPDASWCLPGGEPASPCANGGAFGGKRHSPLPEVARRLAIEHQRPVRGPLVPRGRGPVRAQTTARCRRRDFRRFGSPPGRGLCPVARRLVGGTGGARGQSRPGARGGALRRRRAPGFGRSTGRGVGRSGGAGQLCRHRGRDRTRSPSRRTGRGGRPRRRQRRGQLWPRRGHHRCRGRR